MLDQRRILVSESQIIAYFTRRANIMDELIKEKKKNLHLGAK